MQTIKTYLLKCSFHGLPFVADARFHWSERIFWAVSVILSWWASAYVMYSSYDQFKYSAVSFIVDTSYLDWKTNFPAIVFCEKGNSKYHFYANEWFGRDRNFDTDDILKDIVFFKGSLEGVSYKCSKESDCVLTKGNFTFYADTIRSSCNELFAFCSWNNVEFTCCEQILPVHAIYGVCYGINSIVSSVKPKNHLTMTISHTINSTSGTLAVELLNPDTKIFALSQEAVPLYSEDSSIVMDGVSTSPHYMEENNVFLSVKEVINDKEVKGTSVERRGCSFPDENYLKSAKVYSYSACIVDCLTDLQIQTCNCIHHLMPAAKEKNTCDMEGLICLSNAFKDMTKKMVECDCDSSCTETEVAIVGSTTQQNFTNFQDERSITRVNFILRAPTIRYIRKVVHGYLDLIVSMGGTAGLCVGASLLTTVEIFYYFFVRPFNDSRRQKQSRRRSLRNSKRYRKPPFPFVN